MGAQGFPVFVGFCMAGVTGRTGFAKFLVGMAFLAGNDGVLTDKRESRYIVIEVNHFAPALFIVALLAVFTFLSLVYVIHPVAA